MVPFDPKTLLTGKKNNHNKYSTSQKKHQKKFFLDTDACSQGRFGNFVKHVETVCVNIGELT